MTKKTKSPAASKFNAAKGIGFDPQLNPSGYGLASNPAAVIFSHPIWGIRVHGPFVNMDAAAVWAATDGESEMMGREWVINCVPMDVPATFS
jgi:hypothetical protein